MPIARANGIDIAYETFGRETDSPLVLIMGLAAQMIFWDEGFCEQLARRGFFVVRFDNRDVGQSTKVDHLGKPNALELMQALQRRQAPAAPYGLADMADDTLGLMDALGLRRAHICGASMGGMIAQVLAVRHPERVLSLTSIMSSTGDSELPQAAPPVLALLLEPAPRDQPSYLDYSVKLWRTIGSPGFPFDEAAVRARAALAFERGLHPAGMLRQLLAILADGSRRERLRGLRVPALVIHGEADSLVPIACGEDTAASIPGARFVRIAGMGHDLPPATWLFLVDEIERHARAAERASAA
jgi:pimeloyl-ACP methyl ester carboxylesterase